MASTQEVLNDLVAPVVEALGCEFWGLEYMIHGRQAVLRIYIDKESGVGVGDCEKVSRQLSSVLDVEDPITGHYTLEVSSPGMDRPLFSLMHYQQYVGHKAALKLNRAFEQRKKYTGTIAGVEDDEIVLRVEDEEYLIPFELVDRANIIPVFD